MLEKRSLNVKNFEAFIEYQIKLKFILEYETLKSLLIIAFLYCNHIYSC